MQAGFMDNWIKTTGRVLHTDIYYPELLPVGKQRMHLFVSSPGGGNASMHLMYLLAVAAAKKTIDLQAAYFIPDPIMVQALVTAMERGVRMRLLVPDRHIDSRLVRMASKRTWGKLLAAGAEIYQYEKTMMHNKMLIIDGMLVSVGSTNFDMRSFNLNDEASLIGRNAMMKRSKPSTTRWPLCSRKYAGWSLPPGPNTSQNSCAARTAESRLSN
ncbi:MAG: hypothetical protein WDW36_008999 [Sanguina aurantia]